MPTARELLDAADRAPSPERERLRLAAAAEWLAAGELHKAQAALEPLQLDTTPKGLRPLRALLGAELALAQQAPGLAAQWLEDPRAGFDGIDDLPLEIRLLQVTARLQAAQRLHLAAAQTLALLDPLLSTAEQQPNRIRLWGQITRASATELHQARPRATGDWRGWVELALVAIDPPYQWPQHLAAVQGWQERWPSHPGNDPWPSELAAILQQLDRPARRVALLLPLSGPLERVGQAVLAGFLTGYYEALEDSPTLVERITVIDTNTLDWRHLPAGAFQEHDLLVGPLEKTHLSALAAVPPDSPILGLNYLPETQRAPANMVQFGLAVEDSVDVSAELMARDGHRNIVAVAPSSAWGDRVIARLEQSCQAHGCDLIATNFYTAEPSYSDAVARVLGVTASRERGRALGRVLGVGVEAQPRRRQDLDAVFIAADAEQGRLLVPLLKFHFAGDLPVYGLPSLYEGHPDPDKDRDLNGVRLNDLPWMVNNHPGALELASTWPELYRQQPRLLLFGRDAWALLGRLEALSVETASFPGATGRLRIQQQRVVRTPTPARFRSGRLVPDGRPTSP